LVLETSEYKQLDSWKEVRVCGVPQDDGADDASSFPTLTKVTIGKLPQFSTETTLSILQEAKKAWNGGAGVWPQMSLAQRIQAIETFLQAIEDSTDALATAIMWEIGKSWPEARSEVTRTVQFGRAVIEALQGSKETDLVANGVLSSGSHRTWMRRAALGIVLALGPYNYPSTSLRVSVSCR
jgi:glyceraldehyde-3-phosphate dehydrogenase (NADP+)